MYKLTDQIKLRDIIKKYPDIIKDKTRFKGLLNDITPDHNLEINLIIQAVELGIQKQIMKSKYITNADVHRYIKLMENNYGTGEKYSYYAIKMWCAAYDKNCPTIDFELSSSNVNKKSRLIKKDVIFEDENVCAIFQGWKNVIYSNTGKTKVFKFIFENKSDMRAKFTFLNTSIDGYINIEKTLSYELAEKKKGQQEFIFVYENRIPEEIGNFNIVEFQMDYQLLKEDLEVPFPPHYEIRYEYKSDVISIDI